MKNLIRLDLQHNRIQVIPACLFELPLLRNLNISFNLISELPLVDQWSSSLRLLDCQGNKLQGFPDEVNGALLEYLNISNNNLDRIPLGICKIRTLEELDVSENKDIRVIPVELGRLTKLTQLRLKGLQVCFIC